MIKNIVFDLGNVLLKGNPQIVLENIELSYEIRQNIKKVFFDNWDYLDLGKETIKQHLYKCKFDFNVDESVKNFLLNYYKFRPLNIDMIKLMNRLKQNGYKIFILSNNNKETYEYLKKLPLFNCVDGWVMSHEVHIIKPNKEIYNKLFETFDIKPEECFFIDDNKENIEKGKIFGMMGFIYNNDFNELIGNMKENNIMV